jgi:serine/threonine protein phosphatase PrpC
MSLHSTRSKRNSSVLSCALVAFLFFLLNFLAMSTTLPAFQPLLPQAHSNFTEECPAFGCPIYPAELTSEAYQYIKASFVRNNRQGGDFPFGTENMAIVTQQGASHYQNQDRAVVIDPFISSLSSRHGPSFLVGLFDGHGRQGHVVASHILHEFPQRLARKLNAIQNPSDESIIRALNETFVEVDIYAPPNFLFGGSTGSVTLRLGSKLFIANTGDSQTVVYSVNDTNSRLKETSITYMTRKDKALIPEEYARITGLGGNVHVNPHTNNSVVVVYSVAQRDTIMLGMSRSIGDWEWKPVGVTAEPLIGVVDLKQYPNSFLMAASDGVWDQRRREWYGKQFVESFHGGKTHPLAKCLEVFENITPKAKKGYRDDMTAILMKL